MNYLLYIFFLFSILARFFWDVSFVIGGGGIWSSDILTAFILLAFVFTLKSFKNLRRLFWATDIRKLMTTSLFLFTVPFFVGLFKGYFITTIFRDARLLPIYIIPFVFLKGINNRNKLQKFIQFLYKIILLNLIVFFIMMILNLKLPVMLGIDVEYSTLSGTIHRYGISTATFYYPLLFFIIFNLWIENIISKKIFLFILLGLFFAILYYSMRTLTSGVLFALFLNLFFVRNKTKVINYSLSFVLSLILILSFLPTNMLLNIPQVERYTTIFNSNIGNATELRNKKVRIDAIVYAIEYSDNIIFGSGYGDKKTYSKYKRDNLARWWNHSAIGWMLYKFGVILSIIYLYLYFRIIYKSLKLSNKINNKFIKIILIGISFHLISLLGLAAGTNVFFRGDFLTMMVAIDFGIILVIENLYIPQVN